MLVPMCVPQPPTEGDYTILPWCIAPCRRGECVTCSSQICRGCEKPNCVECELFWSNWQGSLESRRG